MMTTIIAQSSWPEVCGRRNLRTRCAAATRNPDLARFLRLLAKKRSRHQSKPATGGFPSGLSGTALRAWGFPACRFCSLVANRRPAAFPLAARCLPQEEAGALHGTSPAAWE